MERLRAAIDKARALREETTGTETGLLDPPPAAAPARPAPRVAPPPPAQGAALRQMWDALETFEPAAAHLERHRIVSAKPAARVQSAAVAFDKLRTRISQEMRANGWKRLAITSPSPKCGKSTLALNLAYSFARRDDERVVLCEMDLRRPSLAKLLGSTTRKDFTEVLRGEAAFADHAISPATGLAVGPVRSSRARSSELLQSRSAAQALHTIEQAYEPSVMLFDTAPVLVSDDTLGFLEQVDCVLIVVSSNEVTVAEIDACEREVAGHSKVVGLVLNKCDYADETGYGY
jgi:Mrp family chromosome partitioning ATPase